MRSRIVFILMGLTALWGAMLGRAGYLQLVPDHRLQSLEHRQFETVVTLHSRRGDVLDRNGKELAVSVTSYSLFADPKLIDQPRLIVKLLSRELKVPPRLIEDKLHKSKKRFVWIQRHVDKDAHDSIEAMSKKLKVRGIGFVEESRRIYPNDRLLSHAIGFVGDEGAGLEGLELRYNEQLQAGTRKISMKRDARGRPLIVAGQIFNQAPDGADVQLTIDRDLQFTLEQELARAVLEHQADSAVGVVLDAQTSEILAIGSAPTFDPNHAADFSMERKRDRVVTDSYEPGSTMKTFLIAGALNRGMLEPNTKFDCEGGVLHIGKRVIREADTKHKFGILTTSEILAYSSNVGASKIAFKLSDEKLNETLRAFGFGEKTGVDLPGEAKGIVQALPWSEHLLANISFGHGISATPLQIANAYAVIANGGFLKTPFIVKSIRDNESGDITDNKQKTVRRVLSDDAVAKMRLMLTGVTSGDGTGTNARIPGFPVAGKTGTAQKVLTGGRGYMKGGYISSFGGFVPANDPRFVIYVAVDHPRKGYYGAAVAAPIFANVAKFAVRQAGLSPVLFTAANVVPSADRQAKPVADIQSAPGQTFREGVVPDLAGLTLREVMERVAGSGVAVDIRGEGFVTHTIPAPGTPVAAHQDLTVFLTK
jgi:cell division protein FtsI (penicillin-binding protein 3)